MYGSYGWALPVHRSVSTGANGTVISKIRSILRDQRRKASLLAMSAMCTQVQPHQAEELNRALLNKLLHLDGIIKGTRDDGDQLPNYYTVCEGAYGTPKLDLDGTDGSFMASLNAQIAQLKSKSPMVIPVPVDISPITPKAPKPIPGLIPREYNPLLWGLGALVLLKLLR
jgi:hypothetical protein